MRSPDFLLEEYFHKLRDAAFKKLSAGEHLFLNLAAESSLFLRLNSGHVRQAGVVDDAQFEMCLIADSGKGLRKGSMGFTLTGNKSSDLQKLEFTLSKLRSEVQSLSLDPFAEGPRTIESSRSVTTADQLPVEEAAAKLAGEVGSTDMAGIYASGTSVRATAHSLGDTHWFYSQSFNFDYSFYTPEKHALKGTFSGKNWNQNAFKEEMAKARENVKRLDTRARKVERGKYRTYLAPSAVAGLIKMFSWGCVSEASIRQGDSPLCHVRSGEREFSGLFQLNEDFIEGDCPRFNSEGELAPARQTLVANGKLKNSLVCARSAKEYDVPSNGATDSETMRAPNIAAGDLNEKEILKELGEGLYLSNLHYLNWSDQSGGRVTGMTRYACFWVEKGKIVAPIENMRWDDSIFNLFGSELIGFTKNRVYDPNVLTYNLRSLGGTVVPGMLVKKMEFTL